MVDDNLDFGHDEPSPARTRSSHASSGTSSPVSFSRGPSTSTQNSSRRALRTRTQRLQAATSCQETSTSASAPSTPSSRRVHFSSSAGSTTSSHISKKSRPQQPLVIQPKARRTDSYSLRDSGSLQLLQDEILFLTSSSNKSLPDLTVVLNQNRRVCVSSPSRIGSAVLDAVASTTQNSDALAAIWYIIATDCTDDSDATRQWRRTILTHPSALPSLLQVMRADIKAMSHSASSATSESPNASSVTSSVLSSPSSVSSNGSQDPTARGRRRRKKPKLLASITEDETVSVALSPTEESFHTCSTDSSSLTQVLSAIWTQVRTNKHDHACGRPISNNTEGLYAVALYRIISGRLHEEAESCIDRETDDSEEEYNPILWTNRCLAENGVIAQLSAALAESLAKLCAIVDQEKPCLGCESFLRDQVHTLCLLIDGACLFHEDNRKTFCQEGYTNEAGGYLIMAITLFLQRLLDHDKLWGDTIWGDLALGVLRTLTSLTHENRVATRELESQGNFERSGLHVLANVLYRSATGRDSASPDKLRYDAVIFCLNIFTNMVESGCNNSVWSTIKIDGKDVDLLSWLIGWLVNQTRSFRDAITESTFGSSPSKHSSRQLEKEEDEYLVIAGNGFVFFACLLVNDDFHHADLIMIAIPGNDISQKYQFITNTLRAFCNFYHYSVGDLSIAVVAPVKKLIMQLESKQSNEQKEGGSSP